MKFNYLKILIIFLPLTLLTIVSCSSRQPESSNIIGETESLVEVNIIAVMPVEIAQQDDTSSYTDRKELEEGTVVLFNAIKDSLQERDNINYLNTGQVESLLEDFQGNRKEAALILGKKLQTDAVLIPTLNRYIKRVGKTYSVSQPASVSFEYILLHVTTGKVVCSGTFDETQEGLFSNLFTFKKAASRGFKFITAEQLTSEGIKEKFRECKQLAQKPFC